MAMKRYREFDWKITKIAADLKVFFQTRKGPTAAHHRAENQRLPGIVLALHRRRARPADLLICYVC